MEVFTQEMIDASFAKFTIGKEVKGTIVAISDKGVIVNIGGKKDAFIYNADIVEKDKLVAGQEIVAIVKSKNDENGYIKLSQIEAEQNKKELEFASSLKEDSTITFKVINEVKGGIVGKLSTFNVFVPQSQVEFYKRNNLKEYVGKEVTANIMQIDAKSRKIVASIRNYVNAQLQIKKAKIEAEKEEFWSQIKEDVIVKGVVKKFIESGVFVTVGSKDCFLYKNDVSYLNEKPENVLEIGKEYEFLVISCDKETERVNLGYKQLQTNPKIDLYQKYKVGDIVEGKVIKVLKFGVVVELEKNVDGFLHISQAEYGLETMEKDYKVGDMIKCEILDIDMKNFKISLKRKIEYFGDYIVE